MNNVLTEDKLTIVPFSPKLLPASIEVEDTFIPQEPWIILASVILRQLLILLLEFGYKNALLPPLMELVWAYTQILYEPSI